MLNKEWREKDILDVQEGTAVENAVGPNLDDVLTALSRLEDKMESLIATTKPEQPELVPQPSLPMFPQ